MVIQAQLSLIRDPVVRRYVRRLGQKLVTHRVPFLFGHAMELQGRMDAALHHYQQAAALFEEDNECSEEIADKTRELKELVSQVERKR